MVQKLGRAVLALVNRHRINDTELVDRLSVLHKRSFVVTREATIAARQDVGPVTFQGPATVYGLAFGSTCGGPRFEAVAVGLSPLVLWFVLFTKLKHGRDSPCQHLAMSAWCFRMCATRVSLRENLLGHRWQGKLSTRLCVVVTCRTRCLSLENFFEHTKQRKKPEPVCFSRWHRRRSCWENLDGQKPHR